MAYKRIHCTNVNTGVGCSGSSEEEPLIRQTGRLFVCFIEEQKATMDNNSRLVDCDGVAVCNGLSLPL